jgi:hypothetical protein
MLRRLTAATVAASLALAGALMSAPASAEDGYHQRQRQSRVYTPYNDYYSSYPRGNEAVYPNTEDHSAECINGYRWQRHNHDWTKTTGQDTIPLRC